MLLLFLLTAVNSGWKECFTSPLLLTGVYLDAERAKGRTPEIQELLAG